MHKSIAINQYKALLQTAVLLQVAKALNEYYQSESTETDILDLTEEQPLIEITQENMPETREILNPVLHEYTTPVMYTDSTGQGVFLTLLFIGLGVGIVAGATYKGVTSEHTTFSGAWWGDVAKGALVGGALGVATAGFVAMGIGAGVGAYTAVFGTGAKVGFKAALWGTTAGKLFAAGVVAQVGGLSVAFAATGRPFEYITGKVGNNPQPMLRQGRNDPKIYVPAVPLRPHPIQNLY